MQNDLQSKINYAKSLGYSDNQISQYAQPQNTQPDQSQGHGNWFTHLLPTIGSLGAWGLGAALAPETGGLSLAAAAALQAGGGGLGKVAENAFEGNNNLASGVGGAALEGGIGGIGGVLGGKLLKGAGGLIGNFAAKDASRVAENQASQALIDNYGKLSPSLLNKLGFGDVMKTAQTAGIGLTPDELMKGSSLATGANGYLNGTLDNIVRQNGMVDLGGVSDAIRGAIQKNAGVLGDLAPMSGGRGGLPIVGGKSGAVFNQLNRMMQDYGFGGEGSLTSHADPDNALNLLRQVQAVGRTYAGAEPGSTGHALNNVYQEVGDALKQQIYGRPEVAAAIKAFQASPEDMEMLLKNSGGNQQLVDHLTGIVNDAQHANDILQPQVNFVNMNRLANAATNAAKNSLPEVDKGGVVNPVVNDLLGIIHGGGAGTMGRLGAAGSFLNSRLLSPALNISSKAIDAMPSAAPFAAAGIPAQLVAHGSDLAQPSNTTNPGETMNGTTTPGAGLSGLVPGQQQGGAAGAPMGMGGPDDFSPAHIQQLALNAAMYDPGLLPNLGGISSILSPTGMLSGEQQSTVAKTQQAGSALNDLAGAFQKAGGGQGMIGGLLSSLGGKVTGGDAKAFESSIASTASLIARATGADPQTVMNQMPKLTDSKGAAITKLTKLQDLLDTTANATQQTGAQTMGAPNAFMTDYGYGSPGLSSLGAGFSPMTGLTPNGVY